MESNDWRVKKQALEDFEKLCFDHPEYFSPSNINDSFEKLFNRIKDPHRLVAIKALQCLKIQLTNYFQNFKYFYKKIVLEISNMLIEKNVV